MQGCCKDGAGRSAESEMTPQRTQRRPGLRGHFQGCYRLVMRHFLLSLIVQFCALGTRPPDGSRTLPSRTREGQKGKEDLRGLAGCPPHITGKTKSGSDKLHPDPAQPRRRADAGEHLASPPPSSCPMGQNHAGWTQGEAGYSRQRGIPGEQIMSLFIAKGLVCQFMWFFQHL